MDWPDEPQYVCQISPSIFSQSIISSILCFSSSAVVAAAFVVAFVVAFVGVVSLVVVVVVVVSLEWYCIFIIYYGWQGSST